MKDICAGRDMAQPHIIRKGWCVMCLSYFGEEKVAIRHKITHDYWSNILGWTEYVELATRFPDTNTNLPIDGEWIII